MTDWNGGNGRLKSRRIGNNRFAAFSGIGSRNQGLIGRVLEDSVLRGPDAKEISQLRRQTYRSFALNTVLGYNYFRRGPRYHHVDLSIRRLEIDLLITAKFR